MSPVTMLILMVVVWIVAWFSSGFYYKKNNQSQPFGRGFLVGLLVVFIAMIGLKVLFPAHEESLNEDATQSVSVSEEDQVKNRKQQLVGQVQSIPTLEEAIQLSVGMWEDSYNEIPSAAMLIPLWAEKNKINLSMIKGVASTSYGKIMKDSASERGKSLCISGMVGDIAVDRSAGFPVYSGAIVNNNGQIVRYLAMKSTGEIVDGSINKFCGIAVGKMSYDNSQGGTTHAAYLVGMFDLPENR